VIGVPHAAVLAFDAHRPQHEFAWSSTLPSPQLNPIRPPNPWSLLDAEAGSDEPIPAIIDKNTAWYSLKIFSLGSTFDVQYDSGQRVTFKLVGLLNNTILQGSLLISERDFTRAFPDEVGYRFFLIRARSADRQAVISQLENDLADQGFDGRDARELLAELLAVQNTYLSTFQALGALGLLLGTFGLGAVQLRNVFERRRELALLRAVGYHETRLVRLVFLESFVLLMAGLVAGLIAAVVAVFPHYLFGNATVPWLPLAIVFALILLIGWLVVWWASRRVLYAPLLTALREAQ
jgi:ABC-type antimicrobial peptide transport system permease subunit